MAKFEGKQHATAVVVTEKSLGTLISSLFKILAPERSFYWLAIIYGIGISLLSLATPVSVQILINSVVNTGLTTPLIVISFALFGLLLCYGILNALRIHLVDVFGRRFFSRMVSEISLKTIHAENPYFEDAGKTALFNRFFDIIIVTKVVPYLLVGGFTIVSQAVVGFILVSLYHPFFLAFSLFIIFLLILVWIIWGRRAMHSAVELSHSKHATAAWLENLGNSNGFYNADSLVVEALKRSEYFTQHYIEHHIKHFRNHFSQSVSFFFIYAFGSALLLGLGGWLVLQAQLNIGQLVAAELVLTVVFFGISQLGIYLTYFYDLCGAIDELSLFYAVKEEDSFDNDGKLPNTSIQFHNLSASSWQQNLLLNVEIPQQSRVYIETENKASMQLLLDILRGANDNYGGFLSIGGLDIHDMSKHQLRHEIAVLARPRIVNISIRKYLSCAEEVGSGQMLKVIDIVGLGPRVSQLEDGIDTTLSLGGWPFSVIEVMQLKLAAVILAKPSVVVLGEIFDILSDEILMKALGYLKQHSTTTVLYFSRRKQELGFDYRLRLSGGESRLVPLNR